MNVSEHEALLSIARGVGAIMVLLVPVSFYYLVKIIGWWK